MAILVLTGTPEVLAQLPGNTTVTVDVVRTTATDNGDGTWSVTAHASEDQSPGLQSLGCTVRMVVSDAEELARWQVIDEQTDSGTGVA